MAQAQFLGLEGLWKKLVEGKLPARCTKQWYFETFCGVSAAEFEQRGLSRLGAEVDIISHLNGFVKPCECTPCTKPASLHLPSLVGATAASKAQPCCLAFAHHLASY